MLNMFQALSSIPAPREEKEEEGRESTESYLQPPNPGKTISLRWVCLGWVVVAHTFNPSIGRHRQVDLCEFKASLIYRASSRIARATQRNTFWGVGGDTERQKKLNSWESDRQVDL